MSPAATALLHLKLNKNPFKSTKRWGARGRFKPFNSLWNSGFTEPKTLSPQPPLGMLWNPDGSMKSMVFKGWKKPSRLKNHVRKLGLTSVDRTIDKKNELSRVTQWKKSVVIYDMVKWWFPSSVVRVGACVFVFFPQRHPYYRRDVFKSPSNGIYPLQKLAWSLYHARSEDNRKVERRQECQICIFNRKLIRPQKNLSVNIQLRK